MKQVLLLMMGLMLFASFSSFSDSLSPVSKLRGVYDSAWHPVNMDGLNGYAMASNFIEEPMEIETPSGFVEKKFSMKNNRVRSSFARSLVEIYSSPLSAINIHFPYLNTAIRG